MVSVTIRWKKLKSGRQSIYLDVYDRGKRYNKALGLHFDGKKPERYMMEIAEVKRADLLKEISLNDFQMPNKVNDFVRWAKERAEALGYGKRKDLMRHLERYQDGKVLTFKDVTPNWWAGFRQYLELHGQSHNTIYIHFCSLKAFINDAIREKMLTVNALHAVKITRQAVPRVYLTTEELKLLAATDCRRPIVKYAFLFACFTGLRLSDLRQLRPDMIRDNAIHLAAKKTGELVTVNLNSTAIQLLGKLGDDLFKHLPEAGSMNYTLRQWALNAKIAKDIHFHISRHTFATLLIENDVPLQTVQKLLGHTDIRTTQIYAKVLDKAKQAAVDKLPGVDI